jgi:lysophospholipase L1-like esterase
VGGGLLGGLFVLELILQLSSWGVAATGRELPVSWLTAHTRILCLGDSNTYGLWLERDEAYPQQLEAIWNATPGAAPVEVLNMGFPGTNSSRLVRDFGRMLETFQPDLVIVMIGANDYWTMPVEATSADTGGGRRSWVARHSRLWKLYDMLRRARDTAELEVIFDPLDAPEHQAVAGTGSGASDRLQRTGTARFGSAEFALGWIKARPEELARSGVRLGENLGTLADAARDYGVRFVIMTYPSRFKSVYQTANRVIRRAAEESEIELIDLAAAFHDVCLEEHCPEFLFPDHHPSARGYQVVAETLVEQLRTP